MSKGQPSNARVSLSKAQLQEGVGAELYSLCQGMTADGKVSKAEIVALGQWLTDNQNAPLPGIALLTETLKRIVADGRVTRDESRELLEAIEKVLPPDARKGAKAARREVEKQRKAAEREAAKAEREQQRRQEFELYQRRASEDDFDFMVAGVHYEGRHNLVSRYLNIGDRVRLVPEPNNAYDSSAVEVTLSDGAVIGYVPRDDAEDVSGCIGNGGYYVARVKKILTGGRVPIPVIVAEFYRAEQYNDIADLQPDRCGRASANYPTPTPRQQSASPWWKVW
jgi:vacuolar-type H+-ATPase subunit E/Vma4